MAELKAIVVKKNMRFFLTLLGFLFSYESISKESILFKNEFDKEIEVKISTHEDETLELFKLQPLEEKSILLAGSQLLFCKITGHFPFYLFTEKDANTNSVICDINKNVTIRNSHVTTRINEIDSLWVASIQSIEMAWKESDSLYEIEVLKCFERLSNEILTISNPYAIDIMTTYLFTLEVEEMNVLSLFRLEKFRNLLQGRYPNYSFELFFSSLYSKQVSEKH